MNKEVIRVGWDGEVGKLNREKCGAIPAVNTPEGLISETNDTIFNGDFNIMTGEVGLRVDEDEPNEVSGDESEDGMIDSDDDE